MNLESVPLEAGTRSAVPTVNLRTRSLLFWLGLAALLLAGLVLRAGLLDSFPLSPDEGIHLAWLRLLSAGYEPYAEVYITYPPLYPLALDLVWRLWPAETAQRWFSVLYFLFGVVGIALVARKFAGRLAGVVAAGLVLFSPPLVEPSRAILGEFPSVAWSVWAVWLAWLYRDRGRRRRWFLLLSGLCLAASLLTKLLSPFVAGLILLMIVIDRDRLRLPVHFKPVLADIALWGAALLLPAVILLFAFDTRAVIRQVVDQRLEARAAYTTDETFWPPRYERGVMFLREDTVLVALGLVGMGLAWRQRRPGSWIVLAWLGLALVMLAIHNPIRYKHFLILVPPLAVLAGLAVTTWLAAFLFWFHDLKNLKAGLVPVAGLALLAGLYAWQIPAALELWQSKRAVPQPPPDEVEALAFIQQVTAPGDCLITDDMQLLYWSGRMAPPELAEVSTNRLKSGALTLEELIDISDRYDCQLVAAVSNRIPQYLPDYMAWVESKYLGRFHYGEDDLFFAKLDTDPRPATPLSADFDGQLLFHGYSLPAGPYAPGERVPLTLVWQAQADLETDYAVFVHLRGTSPETSQTVFASADHQPYQGLAPTSRWPRGAVIQEVSWLVIPPDLPAGSYDIYVGLYRPDTLERLPLAADTSGENALILGPVQLQ